MLDTLDLLIQKYDSSTRRPLAEPLEVALVHGGVKDTHVLNHLVMHATRRNTYTSVCEEVRNIMFTRATLLNTAPMDIGAPDKEKGRARRVTKAKARRGASRERGAHEGKRMRTQTRVFSASIVGRRDSESVTVANEHANKEGAWGLSRKTRRLQVAKHAMKRKTAGSS